MGALIAVYVLCAIIGLVFFVKVWRMTNDVKTLKNIFVREADPPLRLSSNKAMTKLKYNILLGNLDFVKQELMENFCSMVEGQIYNKLGRLDSSKMENSIRPYVEMLEKQFAKFGEELPEYVKRMETFGDYVNIVSKEDFNAM